jgi:Ca2+-binding EF-hand superfamily protein
MRSVCALALGSVVLLACTPARAQQVQKPTPPTPTIQIVIIEARPGPALVPPVATVTPARVQALKTTVAKAPAATPVKTAAVKPTPATAGARGHHGWFERHDANKDGKIALAEFKGPKDVFARVDADHDGYITRPEATRAYLAFVGMLAIREKAQAFKAMDTNKDGKVSAAEWKGRKEVFTAVDRNKDGAITPAEARRAYRGYVGKMMVAYRIRSMDANKDGKVARSEWKGPKPAFARIDLNHDGYVVAGEVRTLLARRTGPKAPAATPVKPAVATPAEKATKPVKPAAVKATKAVKPATVKPAATAPTARVARVTRVLMAMDANKDGKLCKAEYLKAVEARFSKIDANKDGVITAAEITASIPGPKAVPTSAPARKPAPPPSVKVKTTGASRG